MVVGDFNGHVGLGVKCAKEVATAIRGAIIAAKLNVVPVRRGYWGNKIGKPHTVPTKITGKARVAPAAAPRPPSALSAPRRRAPVPTRASVARRLAPPARHVARRAAP